MHEPFFTIKDTKLFVPVITLSAKVNQELSRLLTKGFEKSVYWNEHKTKVENKNATNECKYSIESNFVRVSRLFLLVYLNQINHAKKYNTTKYYLPKSVTKNYDVIINGKNF